MKFKLKKFFVFILKSILGIITSLLLGVSFPIFVWQYINIFRGTDLVAVIITMIYLLVVTIISSVLIANRVLKLTGKVFLVSSFLMAFYVFVSTILLNGA